MTLSGTSLSAPIVSGIVADLLALRPNLSPDQVKGALMLSAQTLRKVRNFAAGVGEVSAPAAVAVAVPPNPNRGLDRFLVADPTGDGVVFDDAAWLADGEGLAHLERRLLERRLGRRGVVARLLERTSPGRTSPGATSPGADVSWSDVSWSDVPGGSILADSGDGD